MNENPLANLPAAPEEPLTGETVVYRAALDVTWFTPDKQKVDAAAFFRRLKRDEDGVSISTTQYAHRGYLSGPIAGVISVHVERVRQVGDSELEHALDVVIDNRPHGNITNVPFKYRSGPRRKLAERIASLLARNAAAVHEVFDPPHN